MDTKELKKELSKFEKKIAEEVNRISNAFNLTYISIELTPSQARGNFSVIDGGVSVKVAWQDNIDIS